MTHTDPFLDTGDFHFDTPALKQRINLLQHLIQFGDMLLLISGEPGAGKTHLLNQVVLSGSDKWRAAVIDAHDEMEMDELLEKLLRAFDVKVAPATPLELLDTHVQTLFKAGQHTVIFVDDAHRLPADTFAAVLGMAETRIASGLRLVLLGDPRLLDAIKRHSASASIVHHIEMPGLSEAETANYLRECLRSHGVGDAAPLLTDDLVQGIYASSRGVPGLINKAAQGVFVDSPGTAAGDDATATDGDSDAVIPRKRRFWLLPVVAVLITLAVLGLLTMRDEPGAGQPSTRIVPLPAPTPAAAPQASYTPDAERAAPAGGDVAVTPMASAPPPLNAATPTAAPPSAAPAASQVTADSVPSVPATPPAPLPEPVVAAPAPTSEAPADPPAAPPSSEPPVRVPDWVHGKDWIRSQPRGFHTVQVFGTHKPAAMVSFLEQHRVPAPMAWFKSRYQGRPWYIVVAGTYPSKQDARNALRRLPAAIRRQGPWARSFESLSP